MNDYKELIDELNCGEYLVFKASNAKVRQVTKYNNKIANAIEQLVKERDAAVDDLRISSDCDFCKWLVGGDCTDFEHDECHGEHWEWRGLEADDEAD